MAEDAHGRRKKVLNSNAYARNDKRCRSASSGLEIGVCPAIVEMSSDKINECRSVKGGPPALDVMH